MTTTKTTPALPHPRPARNSTDNAGSESQLYVPEAQQWISTSPSRVAGDGYSWMQGVHWVAGSRLYDPRRHRKHGPRSFSRTTLFVAQLLSELSPCRPGVDYLIRRSGLSERAVEYHLQMLRETGLLAWRVKGTRVRGERPRASEFALVLPPEFDAALGIRTVRREETAPAHTRAPVGITDAGRTLMAKLGKKAARKVRKPAKPVSKNASTSQGSSTRRSPKKAGHTAPPKSAEPTSSEGSVTAVADVARCTPMRGGTGSSTSAGAYIPPPESKLENGKRHSPTSTTPKRKARKPRRLNRTGRRYQLARQLIEQVPWLHRAAIPRIAWILQEVSDAGWTALEVAAFLDCGQPPLLVRRPSGLLARRLEGATQLWSTPESRERGVQAYLDSRRAERARHQEWDGQWQAPTSQHVRRQVNDAFTASFHPTPPTSDTAGKGSSTGIGLDDLTAEEITQLRAEAHAQYLAGDTSHISITLSTLGHAAAERLYGPDLVQRAVRLMAGSRSSHLTLDGQEPT